MTRPAPRSHRLAAARAAALAALLALAACDDVGSAFRDRVQGASPHERYAASLARAGLLDAALGAAWQGAATAALVTAATVPLPTRITGYFAPGEAGAAGLRVRLRRGQRLAVTVERQSAGPFALFVDAFEARDGAAPRRLESAGEAGDTSLAPLRLDVEAGRDMDVLVRVQPELLRGGRWTLTLEAAPTLAFPVEGRDSRAVQSRFGVDRDAGRRRHEGVDIFAPRGTPVLAATDGEVRRAGTSTLGGRIVFVADRARAQSLYYAHLDSYTVRDGEQVRTGDTLGFVGNTGNARTTPPHLHFGIYRRGQGAVDPYPFIHAPRERPARVTADTAALGGWRRLARAASVGGTRLAAGTPVRVRAARGAGYRVELPDGSAGDVAAAALEPLTPLGARRRAAPVLDRPVAAAAVIDSAPHVVVARMTGWSQVRLGDGRLGWVAEPRREARRLGAN